MFSSLQDYRALLPNAFGLEGPNLSTVHWHWNADFSGRRASFHDETREGCLWTAVTTENVGVLRRLIEKNWRVIYDEIRGQLAIGVSQIRKILNEHLIVRKHCCRWILYELTAEVSLPSNVSEIQLWAFQSCL